MNAKESAMALWKENPDFVPVSSAEFGGWPRVEVRFLPSFSNDQPWCCHLLVRQISVTCGSGPRSSNMLLGVPTVSGGSKWRVRPASKQFWEAQGCARVLESCREQWGEKELWKKACREYGATVRCNAKLGEMNVKVLFMNGKSKFCSLNHGPSTSSEERPHFMWDGPLMEHWVVLGGWGDASRVWNEQFFLRDDTTVSKWVWVVTQENNTVWFVSAGLNLVASTWIYTKTILCDGRGAGETRFRTCSQIRHHCGKCTLGNWRFSVGVRVGPGTRSPWRQRHSETQNNAFCVDFSESMHST